MVSDIDGTLVTREKLLTAATRGAAAELEKAGIALALTSSRAPAGVAFFADALGLTTPRAAFNSGAIFAPDGTMLQFLAIPTEALRAALDALGDIDSWLFTHQEWLLRNPDGPYVAHEVEVGKMPYRVVEDFAPHFGGTGKLTAVSLDFARLARAELVLQRVLAGHASARRSQNHYLDITHPEATKGEAVRRIAARLNIPLEETAVIGDMANDVPMFETVSCSIAMGNAPPDVQACAAHVTASNEQEGWAQAVRRFVLPLAA